MIFPYSEEQWKTMACALVTAAMPSMTVVTLTPPLQRSCCSCFSWAPASDISQLTESPCHLHVHSFQLPTILSTVGLGGARDLLSRLDGSHIIPPADSWCRLLPGGLVLPICHIDQLSLDLSVWVLAFVSCPMTLVRFLCLVRSIKTLISKLLVYMANHFGEANRAFCVAYTFSQFAKDAKVGFGRQRDSSVGKALASQTWRPEVHFQDRSKNTSLVVCACNSSTEEAEEGRL